MDRCGPTPGKYILRSVLFNNYIADMAGDSISSARVITFHDHTHEDEAPNQRWDISLHWRWYGYLINTTTRFGTPVYAQVGNPDVDSPIRGFTNGLVRPWGFEPYDVQKGQYKIYAVDCKGYPLYWTLSGKDEKSDIIIRKDSNTTDQIWQLEAV